MGRGLEAEGGLRKWQNGPFWVIHMFITLKGWQLQRFVDDMVQLLRCTLWSIKCTVWQSHFDKAVPKKDTSSEAIPWMFYKQNDLRTRIFFKNTLECSVKWVVTPILSGWQAALGATAVTLRWHRRWATSWQWVCFHLCLSCYIEKMPTRKRALTLDCGTAYCLASVFGTGERPSNLGQKPH